MATYKFCENRDLVFYTHYLGEFENEFLKLDGHELIIFGSHLHGYAWDGCTPKFEFLDIYIGVPDGTHREQTVFCGDDYNTSWVPKTYYASLVHDVFYQFKADIPVSRKTADLIFLRLMQRANFKLAYPYYLAVRAFGWMFGKWKTK